MSIGLLTAVAVSACAGASLTGKFIQGTWACQSMHSDANASDPREVTASTVLIGDGTWAMTIDSTDVGVRPDPGTARAGGTWKLSDGGLKLAEDPPSEYFTPDTPFGLSVLPGDLDGQKSADFATSYSYWDDEKAVDTQVKLAGEVVTVTHAGMYDVTTITTCKKG